MIGGPLVRLIAAALALLILTKLFLLYQDPLLEVYQVSWGLC